MAVEMATGEFIAMLDNDDTLDADALLEVARALFHDGDIDVIYTDEDKIDEYSRKIDTYFKPDFSPEHLESGHVRAAHAGGAEKTVPASSAASAPNTRARRITI